MKPRKYLHRVCPLCGNSALSGPVVVTPRRAENLGIDELQQSWNGFFKEKIIFSYGRCDCCGLLYAPEFFTGEQLGGLYSQMPPNMDVVPIEVLRKTQRGYFKELEKRFPLKGSYVEIGPDIGLFTENCIGPNQFDDYWLFEPNLDVLPQLNKLMDGVKFRVLHDLFNFSQVPDYSASAVVMIHVLDHLPDPHSTLSELQRTMGKDSILLIVTHDEGSLLPKIMGSKWPAYCLQHPQIYNSVTIRRQLDIAGFDVVGNFKTVNHFPISFLSKHLLWALGVKVENIPTFWNASVGLKLGNMLTLATPKLC